MIMGIKVLECKLTSVNKCVEVEHLRESIDQGKLMYSQRTIDGMKSAGRRALRNPPSSNMRYSAKLYNVEGLDHNVHEPVTVLRMADMQSQDN